MASAINSCTLLAGRLALVARTKFDRASSVTGSKSRNTSYVIDLYRCGLMAWVSAVTACNVYPSAGARATAVVPMFPVRADAIVDDNRLSQLHRQLLADDARRDVDHAAGRPSHDDLQRSVWIFRMARKLSCRPEARRLPALETGHVVTSKVAPWSVCVCWGFRSGCFQQERVNVVAERSPALYAEHEITQAKQNDLAFPENGSRNGAGWKMPGVEVERASRVQDVPGGAALRPRRQRLPAKRRREHESGQSAQR